MRKLLLLFFLFALPVFVYAQYFGGAPASRKWMQLGTDSVRIIFPAGMDSQANRVASIVQYMASQKPVSLGDKLKKINIVLQHETTIPNGYVQLGPFRSEFYMTPSPDNFDQGTIPWADQLALHEYRHVQQFNNFNNGMSHLMKILFGEEGYTVAINAAVPDWFFEGDAVYNETVLTRQGRGRIPQFTNAFPSLWQANKNYGWMKLRNGSFKDYVPTHYHLGYLLVNYGYEKYGPDFWKKVTKDASAYKGLFYPFQLAIKRHAGVEYDQFRKDAFDFYKKKTERTAVTRDEFLFPVNKKYVNSYYFPYQAGGDSLYYQHASFRHRSAFYLFDGKKRDRQRTRDVSIDEQFSYKSGKIVYSAFQTDPRWGWRTYSVLRVVDTKTGKQKKLTNKTRYFTPDISADGTRVAAVQNLEGGNSAIHILDATNGKVLHQVQSPSVNLFTDPKFLDDHTVVTAIRMHDGRMTLATADFTRNEINDLLPRSFNVIGFPAIDGDRIYFTASFGGNDDVYVMKRSEKKIYKVSDGPLGNYNVTAGAGKITWSAMTAEGEQLRQVNEKDIVLKEVASQEIAIMESRFPVSLSKDLAGTLDKEVPWKTFPSSTYKKGTGLLNFHSWRPYYEDPIFTFSLYGENVLNTMQTEIYYLYNQNDNTSGVGFSGLYGGWYPVISFGSEFTFNRESLLGSRVHRRDQLDSRVGFIIPLTFINGRSINTLSINNSYVLRNEFNKDFIKDSLGNTNFSYLSHSISWSQQAQRAVQDIFPRWGYSMTAMHRYPVSRYEGYQFYGAASLYLPGVIHSHSLVLTGAFQQRDTARLIFSSRIANARGFTDYYNTRAGSRLWRLSANYHFPVWHPDFGIASIVYIQRWRANLFYDQQRLFSDGKDITYDLKSAGVEFFLDTKWWNQHPLTFGFRISRLLEDDPRGEKKGKHIFEFIMPVNIIPR